MAGNANSGGRNAKSVARHVAAGTYRGDRHDGFDTPAAPTGLPSPPRKLTGHAVAEWDRMVKRLSDTKAISTVDDAALYQYVCLFDEVERITDDNARLRGMVEKLMRGVNKLQGQDFAQAVDRIATLENIIARHMQQLRQGHMAIRMYLVEFGMTPSARTRVKLPKGSDDKPKGKLMAFLGGRSGEA